MRMANARDERLRVSIFNLNIRKDQASYAISSYGLF